MYQYICVQSPNTALSLTSVLHIGMARDRPVTCSHDPRRADRGAHAPQALEHYHARDDGGAAGREHLLLPHEAKPLQNDTLRQIVEKLLTPAPEARWTSEDLRVHLELNTTSLTMRGLPQAPPVA